MAISFAEYIDIAVDSLAMNLIVESVSGECL